MRNNETVQLKQLSDGYEVVSLINRMEPKVGNFLEAKGVEKLLQEAACARNYKLTIKITG